MITPKGSVPGRAVSAGGALGRGYHVPWQSGGIVSLLERISSPLSGIRRNTGNGQDNDGIVIGPHGATELPVPIAKDE